MLITYQSIFQFSIYIAREKGTQLRQELLFSLKILLHLFSLCSWHWGYKPIQLFNNSRENYCVYLFISCCVLTKSPRRSGHLFLRSETFTSNVLLYKNIIIKVTLHLIFDFKPKTERRGNCVDLLMLQRQLPVLWKHSLESEWSTRSSVCVRCTQHLQWSDFIIH